MKIYFEKVSNPSPQAHTAPGTSTAPSIGRELCLFVFGAAVGFIICMGTMLT